MWQTRISQFVFFLNIGDIVWIVLKTIDYIIFNKCF